MGGSKQSLSLVYSGHEEGFGRFILLKSKIGHADLHRINSEGWAGSRMQRTKQAFVKRECFEIQFQGVLMTSLARINVGKCVHCRSELRMASSETIPADFC